MIGSKSLAEQIEEVLMRERQALVAGRIKEFPAILEEKTQLFDLLKSHDKADENIKKLVGMAARNQVLLDEAMAGIRSVARKISRSRAARKSVDTYDHMGKKSVISPDPKVSVERHA